MSDTVGRMNAKHNHAMITKILDYQLESNLFALDGICCFYKSPMLLHNFRALPNDNLPQGSST